VDSSRLWQTTKSRKQNIFNDLHTYMEDAGTEFGLPRRCAPRNDGVGGRNNEILAHNHAPTSKPSSLRAQRGNPHTGSVPAKLMDCRVALRLACDERWGFGVFYGMTIPCALIQAVYRNKLTGCRLARQVFLWKCIK
jgi:hypothetical protein